MFGRGRAPMTSTGKYVMAMGRKAGNVTSYTMPPKGSQNREGRGTASKTALNQSKTTKKMPQARGRTPKASPKSYGRLGTV